MAGRIAALAATLFAAIFFAACASSGPTRAGQAAKRQVDDASATAAADSAVETAVDSAAQTGADDAAGAGSPDEAREAEQPSSLDPIPADPAGQPGQEADREDPCSKLRREGETSVEAARRVLAKTVCGAALWFDGLFGDQRNLESARQTSGRVELSVTESEYWGTKERVRFNVRMRLPNLERHFEAFAGHEDESDFVEDRTEGFALRSQFRAIEEEDRWVAGLGYSLPGSYERRSDVRVGVHGVSSPELFVQGRHRRNWYVGEKTLWHFRQAIFWTNRDGFGATTGLDFGRVLTPRLLFRWGNVGTFSESTDGVNYRTVMVLYRNLGKSRALALESFARGETDDEEPLREYGIRAVFRRPIGGKDWLFGELVGGYGWIKENDNHDREGSATVGFGVELLFGQRDPYRNG